MENYIYLEVSLARKCLIKFVDSIFEFSTEGWKELDIKLSIGRSHLNAIVLPQDSNISCQ